MVVDNFISNFTTMPRWSWDIVSDSQNNSAPEEKSYPEFEAVYPNWKLDHKSDGQAVNRYWIWSTVAMRQNDHLKNFNQKDEGITNDKNSKN